jgi:hypothetical protein
MQHPNLEAFARMHPNLEVSARMHNLEASATRKMMKY